MAKCKHPAYATSISARKAADSVGRKAKVVRCEDCRRWKVVAD